MPHTTDLSGMSVETALAVAARDMDRAIAGGLANVEIVMTDHGATDDELAAELERWRAEYAEWREKTLGELRGWIARGGESLN